MTASVTHIRRDTDRMALVRVEESTDQRQADVRVTLVFEGDEHVGLASGVPGDGVRPALVAAATLDALSFIEGIFELVDTSTAYAGGIDVAMVIIKDPDLERPLIGTAALDDDNRQMAYAKAVLDAVNRRIENHL